MNRKEIETILHSHLEGVHEELNTLFRGIEKSLNAHLTNTEKAISDALENEMAETNARLDAIEKRVAQLEERN